MKSFLVLTAFCILSIFVLPFITPLAAQSVTGDEFVGPFANWTNIKIVYGAKGDGTTDDTTAFQNALTAVGTASNGPVIWIPAGTYRITGTITLANREGVSVICEDPANTTIKWAGASGGTMFRINGVDSSRFNRCTWDGSSSAGIAIDQSWDGVSGTPFDTGNEYTDDTLKYVGIGLRCGFLGQGCAETSVQRGHFIYNTTAGILMGNYNALDMWVRYSEFDHCYEGVTNSGGAGNFKVYNSVFRNCSGTDLRAAQGGEYSFRYNYSIGSWRHIWTDLNAKNVNIQGETALDTADSNSIVFEHAVMYDTVIRSSMANGSLPSVNSGSPAASITLLGNTFTVNPYLNHAASIPLKDIDSSVVSRTTINPAEPALPPTAPNFHRTVFEIAPSASTATIQSTINTASAAPYLGTRPVVHLQGNADFLNTTTLTIPANSDVQLMGDGFKTRILASGGSGPLLKLSGPVKATLRDIKFDAADQGHTGTREVVVADNIDQPGARVFMHNFVGGDPANAMIFFDQLDHSVVDMEDTNHGYSHGTGGYGFKTVGGPLAAAGTPAEAQVRYWSGSSSDEDQPYDVNSGGNFLMFDNWYEGSPSSKWVAATGRATVTLQGSKFAPNIYTAPNLNITGLNGTFLFNNGPSQGQAVISGDGTNSQVLSLAQFEADYGWTPSFFVNNASPAGVFGIVNDLEINSADSDSHNYPNSGTTTDAFVRSMMAQARVAQPQVQTTPAGVTDFRIYRTTMANGVNGLHLIGGSTVGTAPTASLSANPTSITASQSSTLTWSSTNAASCTGAGFSTGNAVSGSVSVSPTVTTNYSVTCAGSGGSSSPASATLTVGTASNAPVGWWSFDTGTISGTAVSDVSGNNNTGAIIGSPMSVPGVVGQALNFDGSTQWISVVNGATIAGKSQVTISCWVKLSSAPAFDAPCYAESTSRDDTTRIALWISTTQQAYLRYRDSAQDPSGNGTNVASSKVLNSKTWYHLAGVYDSVAGTIKLYINGALDSSGVSGGTLGSSATAGIGIGRLHADVGFLPGAIDDVRVYSRALSASEIQALYDSVPPSVPTNLTGTAISSSQLNLSWTASTDNIAVVGYNVYRNGAKATAVTSGTSYSDTGLAAATTYNYAVAAYDAAGNTSAQSVVFSIFTQPVGQSIAVGSRVVTTAKLNIHSSPSTNASRLGSQAIGASGTVIGGPTSANGYTWWQINYDTGADGWSVATYLSPAQATTSPVLGMVPVIRTLAHNSTGDEGEYE